MSSTRYVSTRGGMEPRPFTEILLEGLAPDGGLVVPETYPRLTRDDLDALRPLGYRDLAFAIISRFVGDIPAEDLRRIIDRTYTAEAFGSDDITPVEPLFDDFSLLCTSNGPSLAFKDVAMQFLGQLFAYVLEKSGEELNILGATSGDTGGAAIYAMRSKPRIRVFMLSPLGRTSTLSRELELVLRVGLAAAVEDRFATAAELRNAFESAFEGRITDRLRKRAEALMGRAPWAESG